MIIDFHCHSNHSDGADSVQELYQKALHNNVEKLALTDHDSVSGIDELEHLCSGGPIELVHGIEFSARWKKHDIHILGLYIDHRSAAIVESIRLQQARRNARAKDIADVLEGLGLENCWEKAQNMAGHAQITRPHFAKILMDEGWVKTMQSAFTQYLSRGKKAYIATEWMSISETVSTIRKAGGVAVLAHPLKYQFTRSKLHELLKQFKEAEGEGMEVVSGETHHAEVQNLSDLCNEFDLYASTGSDYHGLSSTRVQLGCQRSLPQNCRPIWELRDI